MSKCSCGIDSKDCTCCKSCGKAGENAEFCQNMKTYFKCVSCGDLSKDIVCEECIFGEENIYLGPII